MRSVLGPPDPAVADGGTARVDWRFARPGAQPRAHGRFRLTGWATALVVASWTGSRTAGVLSGSLLAFNSFTLTRLAQIQDLHLEFFAPALFALDRFIVTAQTRDALNLAGWFVLQALTGTYVMLFTAISLVVATAARAGEWVGSRFVPFASRALLAVGAASVALTPVLVPYVIASREVD